MALTWREVSGVRPIDQTPALELFNKFANSAVNKASTGLADWQTAREARAGEQVSQAAQRFTNPDDYAAAIASGQATQGIDSDLVTSKLLEAAKAREGTLRTQQTEQAKRVVPGLQNQFFDLVQSGATDKAKEFLKQNNSTFARAGSPLADNATALSYMDKLVQENTARENKPILDALGQHVAVGDVNAAKTLVNAYSNRIPAEALAKVTPIIDKHTVDQLIPQFTGSLKDTLGKATERYNSLTPGQKPLFAAAYNKLVGTNAIGDSANDAETAAKIAAGEPLTPPGGPPTTNTTGGNKVEAGSAYADRVGLNTKESSNKTDAKNDAIGSSDKKGHFGLLQFSQDRLADAKAAGVIRADMTPEEYLRTNKEFQNKVADWHFADIDKQATKAGIEDYYGTTIKGVTINRDSVRAMAHLGGMGGLMDFIKSGGKKDYEDVNGTKISDYGKKFGNGVPDPATQLTASAKPNNNTNNNFATQLKLLQNVPELQRNNTGALLPTVDSKPSNATIEQYNRILGRDTAINNLASKIIAGTAGIPPAAASTGAESIPLQTNEEASVSRFATMNAVQLNSALTSMAKVTASNNAARMGDTGRFLPEIAAKNWGDSAGDIEASLKKKYPDIKSEKWQEVLAIAEQKYPNLPPAVIAEAITTASLDKGFWESGVPVISWLNETDAVAPKKFKANLEKANKAIVTSTLANEGATNKLEFAKKYAEQFAKAEEQLRNAQLLAAARNNPNDPALIKAQKFFDEAKRSATIAAASFATSK